MAGGAEGRRRCETPAEDEEGEAGQAEEDEVDGDDVAEDLFVGAGEGDDDGDELGKDLKALMDEFEGGK